MPISLKLIENSIDRPSQNTVNMFIIVFKILIYMKHLETILITFKGLVKNDVNIFKT